MALLLMAFFRLQNRLYVAHYFHENAKVLISNVICAKEMAALLIA